MHMTSFEKARPLHRPLHRIKQARKSAGVSLRTIARRTKTTVTALRAQEHEHADIRLSDLYRWQQGLRIPVEELLQEPAESLSEPIRQRACLLRIAKTAHSLVKECTSPATQSLAQTLLGQLVEIMPELKDVGPWHDRGQLRSLDELGRVAEAPIETEQLLAGPPDDE
jgi:transcriptional regulator with XRE-family HTH domain